jgi:hypothetical protein
LRGDYSDTQRDAENISWTRDFYDAKHMIESRDDRVALGGSSGIRTKVPARALRLSLVQVARDSPEARADTSHSRAAD